MLKIFSMSITEFMIFISAIYKGVVKAIYKEEVVLKIMFLKVDEMIRQQKVIYSAFVWGALIINVGNSTEFVSHYVMIKDKLMG